MDGSAIAGLDVEPGRLVRRTALAIVTVDVVAVACLVGLSIWGGLFGPLNDLANAVFGGLCAALAVLLNRTSRLQHSRVGVASAGGGALLMILGSVLVMSGLAGWFLAGLVSAVGSALIGFWLLRINRAGQFTRDLRTLGFLAGLVMLVGLLGLLGVLRGLDDWQAAPWFVICSQLSWLGTYGLYPIWCVGLARRLGRAGSGRLTPSRSGSGETRT